MSYGKELNEYKLTVCAWRENNVNEYFRAGEVKNITADEICEAITKYLIVKGYKYQVISVEKELK